MTSLVVFLWGSFFPYPSLLSPSSSSLFSSFLGQITVPKLDSLLLPIWKAKAEGSTSWQLFVVSPLPEVCLVAASIHYHHYFCPIGSSPRPKETKTDLQICKLPNQDLVNEIPPLLALASYWILFPARMEKEPWSCCQKQIRFLHYSFFLS